MKVLDLRLLPIAGALWIGCAVGLHTALHFMLLPTIALLMLLTLFAHRVRHRSRIWGITIAFGILLAALRVDAASPDVISDLLASSGAVRFEAVVGAEPKTMQRRACGGLETQAITLARVTLVRLSTKSSDWNVSIPATVQWSSGSAALPVGARITSMAVLHPDDAAAGSAYRISLPTSPDVIELPSRGTHLATEIRRGLATATNAQRGGSGATLLPGLVLGDTRAQSEQLVEDLRASGLSHLTAVSGANLAIVIAAIMWMLRRTSIRALHRHALVLLAIGAFVVVVQPQPSVLRAAVMGGIGVFAMMAGERSASASVLWLSVVALLILDPFLAWQYGFALSVAATAGLIVLRPFLLPHLPGGWFGDALVVTVSAQLATWPLLLMMGRPPTWVSIPANLICEPLVAPATVFGFAAAVIAALALLPVPSLQGALLSLASVIAIPGVALAAVIARIASLGASSQLAVAPVTTPLPLLLLLLVMWALRRYGLPMRWIVLGAVLALVVSSCAPHVLSRWPQKHWWYAMCDVGQGDATVFSLGSGRAIVVDAGPDPVLMRACLRSLGVRKVEALFLTHFHADHVEGVRGIIQQAAVQHVFTTPLHEPASEWRRTRETLHIPMVDLRAGDVVHVGSTSVAVLWPVVEALDGTPNNASLVLDVSVRGVHVLVTGDADAAAQQALVLPVAGYAVLKVPHHGSRYQDPEFVRRVSPSLALVSVGAGNDYGHPAAQTMDALQRAGVRVLRTDRVGAIAVSVEAAGLRYVTSSG